MTHRLTQAGCVRVLRTESDNMQNFFSTLSACQYTVCTCFRGAANISFTDTHTHLGTNQLVSEDTLIIQVNNILYY